MPVLSAFLLEQFEPPVSAEKRSLATFVNSLGARPVPSFKRPACRADGLQHCGTTTAFDYIMSIGSAWKCQWKSIDVNCNCGLDQGEPEENRRRTGGPEEVCLGDCKALRFAFADALQFCADPAAGAGVPGLLDKAPGRTLGGRWEDR